MAKTTNLGLNLTENENTSFADWRKSIDGLGNSNFQIIDEAIGALKNIGISDISVDSTTVSGEYTITPITFTKSDGSTQTLEIKAKNGADCSGGSGEKEIVVKTMTDLYLMSVDDYKSLVSRVNNGEIILVGKTDTQSLIFYATDITNYGLSSSVIGTDNGFIRTYRTSVVDNKVTLIFNDIPLQGSGSSGGGITETRVTELINQALGVIENGTY